MLKLVFWLKTLSKIMPQFLTVIESGLTNITCHFVQTILAHITILFCRLTRLSCIDFYNYAAPLCCFWHFYCLFSFLDLLVIFDCCFFATGVEFFKAKS